MVNLHRSTTKQDSSLVENSSFVDSSARAAIEPNVA